MGLASQRGAVIARARRRSGKRRAREKCARPSDGRAAGVRERRVTMRASRRACPHGPQPSAGTAGVVHTRCSRCADGVGCGGGPPRADELPSAELDPAESLRAESSSGRDSPNGSILSRMRRRDQRERFAWRERSELPIFICVHVSHVVGCAPGRDGWARSGMDGVDGAAGEAQGAASRRGSSREVCTPAGSHRR